MTGRGAAAARQALGRAQGRGARRGRPSFAAALVALVLLGSVAALAVAAAVFGAIHASAASSDNLRLSCALVANTVRAQDRLGAVGVAEGPEGDALVLTARLGSGDYETRLYLFEGHVVRETALAGTPLRPSAAERLARSDTFSFSLDGDLLTVVTDEGRCPVALRGGVVTSPREGP
ncbi:DUF4860 domain-containing protein [Caniella muris]|uniref:DUF4860 domain-containing protein n=1 Tax=Caniella muris TaxID=2941502 RepID=UPI00203B1C19|nr:DUF4860 domain-containing protein [Caniella muris]